MMLKDGRVALLWMALVMFCPTVGIGGCFDLASKMK